MSSPSALNWSPIWSANSRVGVRISANIVCGVSMSDCKMGRAKAPVFPEPVSANPITSFPCSATGIASRWILLGFFHFSNLIASQITSFRPWGEGEMTAMRKLVAKSQNHVRGGGPCELESYQILPCNVCSFIVVVFLQASFFDWFHFLCCHLLITTDIGILLRRIIIFRV